MDREKIADCRPNMDECFSEERPKIGSKARHNEKTLMASKTDLTSCPFSGNHYILIAHARFNAQKDQRPFGLGPSNNGWILVG